MWTEIQMKLNCDHLSYYNLSQSLLNPCEKTFSTLIIFLIFKQRKTRVQKDNTLTCQSSRSGPLNPVSSIVIISVSCLWNVPKIYNTSKSDLIVDYYSWSCSHALSSSSEDHGVLGVWWLARLSEEKPWNSWQVSSWTGECSRAGNIWPSVVCQTNCCWYGVSWIQRGE